MFKKDVQYDQFWKWAGIITGYHIRQEHCYNSKNLGGLNLKERERTRTHQLFYQKSFLDQSICQMHECKNEQFAHYC